MVQRINFLTDVLTCPLTHGIQAGFKAAPHYDLLTPMFHGWFDLLFLESVQKLQKFWVFLYIIVNFRCFSKGAKVSSFLVLQPSELSLSGCRGGGLLKTSDGFWRPPGVVRVNLLG